MAMDWFKLHHNARVDKKLSALSDAQHRIWFNLLCFASEQKERGHIPETKKILLAVEVANGNQTALQETLDLLVTFQIIETKDGIKFLHWAERQYINPSDAPSATRIRKQSSRMSRACHEVSRVSRAQIQIQIADTDPDTEKKKKDPPLPPQRAGKRAIFKPPEFIPHQDTLSLQQEIASRWPIWSIVLPKTWERLLGQFPRKQILQVLPGAELWLDKNADKRSIRDLDRFLLNWFKKVKPDDDDELPWGAGKKWVTQAEYQEAVRRTYE